MPQFFSSSLTCIVGVVFATVSCMYLTVDSPALRIPLPKFRFPPTTLTRNQTSAVGKHFTVSVDLLEKFAQQHPCAVSYMWQKRVLAVADVLVLALRSRKLTFWMAYGTLLGAAREGEMIAHDHDIDFGMWMKDVAEVKKLLSDETWRPSGLRGLAHVQWMAGDTQVRFTPKERDGKEQFVEIFFATQSGAMANSPSYCYRKKVKCFGVKEEDNLRASGCDVRGLVCDRECICFPVGVIGSPNSSSKSASATDRSVNSTMTTFLFERRKWPAPARTYDYLRWSYGKNWRAPGKPSSSRCAKSRDSWRDPATKPLVGTEVVVCMWFVVCLVLLVRWRTNLSLWS